MKSLLMGDGLRRNAYKLPVKIAAKDRFRQIAYGELNLRIVDDESNPVAVNQIGEIICQSPLATEEYYINPEATNASFRDGWFYTGDLGYFDEEGYRFVVGRKKIW